MKQLVLLALLVVASSCGRAINPAQYQDDCLPVAAFHLNHSQLTIVKAALRTRVDTRRRKFTLTRFCGYQKYTSNRKFVLLTIYQPGVSHVSCNWVLLSASQAVDTKLNQYYMVTDSVGTQQLIDQSIRSLIGLDDVSKQELLRMLIKDSRDYRRKGVILGSQKPPMP